MFKLATNEVSPRFKQQINFG